MIDRTRPDGPAGRLVVPCGDLEPAVDAWQALGFRLDAIGPADEPTWAELSVPGLQIELDAGAGAGAKGVEGPGPRLRVERPDGTPVPDPGVLGRLGLEVEIDSGTGPRRNGPTVPPTDQSLVISHEADGTWKEGRAGMRYRDLIPDRFGGAYIASHIHIPEGGPVPDYVHYHDIVHQLIFCHRGWVRVVYQDQGPPFLLEPGDCVLQPPGIRHRVLETSDDLYVVEVGCPAVHRTSVDHDLELPNRALEPDRRYGGQRFVRHVSARSPWLECGGEPALVEQDTGLAAATDGLVSARLVRVDDSDLDRAPEHDLEHDGDLLLLFVVGGSATLVGGAGPQQLTEGSSATVPAGAAYRLDDIAPGTVLFEVRAAIPPRA